LDNKVPAIAQTGMLMTIRAGLMQSMEHLLMTGTSLVHVLPGVEANLKGLAQLEEWLAQHAGTPEGDNRLAADWSAQEVPSSLAQHVARLPILVRALDLISLAAKNKLRVGDVAAIYFGFEKRLGIGWLNRLIVSAKQTPWQREAVAGALEELASNHRRLTAQLAAKSAKGKKVIDVAGWVAANEKKLAPYDALLAEWSVAGVVDLAMVLLANERLADLSV